MAGIAATMESAAVSISGNVSFRISHGQKTLGQLPHFTSIPSAHLIDLLTDAEIDHLTRIAAKVLQHFGTP